MCVKVCVSVSVIAGRNETVVERVCVWRRDVQLLLQWRNSTVGMFQCVQLSQRIGKGFF